MSDYSIEHSLVFNSAKRIFKFVAPDFRVVARNDIFEKQSILNLTTKTLEVPEGDPYVAAGAIIFNAGLMSLRFEENFLTVFGKIPKYLNDAEAAELTAKEHTEADELAYSWAVRTMSNYFPELDDQKVERLADHRLSYENWLNYFSS